MSKNNYKFRMISICFKTLTLPQVPFYKLNTGIYKVSKEKKEKNMKISKKVEISLVKYDPLQKFAFLKPKIYKFF